MKAIVIPQICGVPLAWSHSRFDDCIPHKIRCMLLSSEENEELRRGGQSTSLGAGTQSRCLGGRRKWLRGEALK